jgi:hypothetical protein
MILRRGAKSLIEASKLRRRFASKEPGGWKGYKTLILYSTAIAAVGAAAGSLYTHYRLKKSNQDGEKTRSLL